MKPEHQQNLKRERRGALLHDERGSAMIMVAVAIFATFAFAILAIDAPILMVSRTQLQSAADAAALAGASGLAYGSSANATDRAINFASYNDAVQDTMRSVVITATDVTFPEPGVIRVQTHRTAATGDALRTYFLRIVDQFSNNTADMTAVAAARIYNVCGSDCLKPWAIPDRWDDTNLDGVYTDGELYDPVLTGYQAPGDVGFQITLKVGNPNQAISPGIFYPVDFPPLNNEEGIKPLTGGAWYEQWIMECSPYTIEPGDSLQIEPGNMVGPTFQGMEDLYDLDPNAYWDETENTVVGSDYGWSPRIGLVPFFDPMLPPESGRNAVLITKIAAVFIEQISSNQVTARFMAVTHAGTPCGEEITSSFIKGITLIE